MKNLTSKILFLFVFLTFTAYSWNDKTHISVGTAAGYRLAYSLSAPDVAKQKAKKIEETNHYCNIPESFKITPEFVKNQIDKYNDPNDTLGHLYGAIIGGIREYQNQTKKGKYAEYNLVYVGHYCGDLSMPLHNMDYNDYNKKNHSANDATVEEEVSTNIDKIVITAMKIENENDLINYIIAIATESQSLGYKLVKENRNMTKDEAYERLSRSASIFKAILEYVKYK